ncbi:type II toxin-antitoxin system RelE/ParE family toxin [Cohnella kolymensis]|uniref:type II toxin-antitoxin system RelE/ParE family toxin n=1 Tax=Cohnella kolymensis TaxID=1590652 RepID=UPI0038990902
MKDISNSIHCIKLDNPGAALSMTNKFVQSISLSVLFPNSGTIPDDIRLQSLSYKKLVIKPYLIFYVVENDTVEIRRIHHRRRKYNFLL